VTLYADTSFYVALILPSDSLHERAVRIATATQEDRQITSELIIFELLDEFCEFGSHLRRTALEFVDALHANSRVEIVPLTSGLLSTAIELYRLRPDTGYSLTDCLSMVICERRGIHRVLTHDRHFVQEGLEVLL
jgi:uncharacterized protein